MTKHLIKLTTLALATLIAGEPEPLSRSQTPSTTPALRAYKGHHNLKDYSPPREGEEYVSSLSMPSSEEANNGSAEEPVRFDTPKPKKTVTRRAYNPDDSLLSRDLTGSSQGFSLSGAVEYDE